jgi:hypothetical protein
VFARRRLLAEPSPFDLSQPCFSSRPSADREVAALRDTGNPGFAKNQEKTSGTLYSVFKEPDPGTHPRTTPFFRRPRSETSAKRRTLSIAKSSLSVNDFVGRARTRLARRAFQRTGNPCGDAKYRTRDGPCQAFRKKREKANEYRAFLARPPAQPDVQVHPVGGCSARNRAMASG